MATYKNGPMARNRILLRTHHCNPMRGRAAPQSLKSLVESRQSTDAVIAGLSINVTFPLGTACSEFPPEENVLNPRILQRIRQCFTIELRMKPTVRLRTNIGNRANTMPREQCQKLRRLVIRVPNCEKL